jgi:hypothetical protein
MKIKNRLRKALFHFFKQEIMEYTEPVVRETESLVFTEYVVPFTTLILEKVFDIEDLQTSGMPAHYFFRNMQEDMKNEFWNSIRECIHVETNMLNPQLYPEEMGKVKFILRIQKPIFAK